METKVRVPFTLGIEELVSSLVNELSHEDLYEIIIRIDCVVSKQNFTNKVAQYFDFTRDDQPKEQVCEATPLGNPYIMTGCKCVVLVTHNFCPNCGGKIKVKVKEG